MAGEDVFQGREIEDGQDGESGTKRGAGTESFRRFRLVELFNSK